MEITKDEFERANANMKELQAKSGTVTSATFDPNTRSIILKLSTGIGVFFSPEEAQGLENATPAQLSEIEITPSGLGLRFPQLDADIWVPSLLEGVLGSRKWMAARLGAAGGQQDQHRQSLCRPRQRLSRPPPPPALRSLNPKNLSSPNPRNSLIPGKIKVPISSPQPVSL